MSIGTDRLRKGGSGRDLENEDGLPVSEDGLSDQRVSRPFAA
jgi:hypothetical protein